MNENRYIGRFAPSPSGPLHYGSLVAATASYLQAKHQQGDWLIRIEDIDPLREIKGATDEILTTLERYHFEWDAQPIHQSSRLEQYREVISNLISQDMIYACSCSRKDLHHVKQTSELGKCYPGTCANKKLDTQDINYNLRVRTNDANISFNDLHFGEQTHNINKQLGDFVLYRKFDLPTYALAVTVDDAFQEVTEVVRGQDLLAFTPMQIYLCKLLDLPIPRFFHVPIIVNDQGQKLSKQHHAEAISKDACEEVLVHVLHDLGQAVPKQLSRESLDHIWSWAIEHWDINAIPQRNTIAYNA